MTPSKRAADSAEESSSQRAKSESPDVVVVGSSNVDLVVYAPRLPALGETLTGLWFQQRFGGKGANQAVAAARLGSKTVMVSKVGSDNLGQAYLDNYRSLGVDVAHVAQTADAATGVAQITVDSAGQNCIIIVPGANGLLTEDDVAAASAAFAERRVLLAQLEVPLQSTIAALRQGRKAGMITIFNPAPAPTEELPAEIYGLCDVICPNESETSRLTGLPTDTMDECEAAARAILAKGAKAVVLTLGERGCMLVTPSSVVRVPVPSSMGALSVVDTVGAGDAFLGALAHLMASGRSLEKALPGAVHVASVSVQQNGAQESYPAMEDLPTDFTETSSTGTA